MFKFVAAFVLAFSAIPSTVTAQQLDGSQCDASKSIVDDMFQGSFCMEMKGNPVYVRVPATMTAMIGGKTQNYVAWAPALPQNSRPRYNPGHCYWQRADPDDPLTFMGPYVDIVILQCSFTRIVHGQVENKSSAIFSTTYAKTEGETLKETLVAIIIDVNGKNLSPTLFRSETPGEACNPPACKSDIRDLDVPDADVLDDIMLMDFTYAFDLIDPESSDFTPLPAVFYIKGFASKWR